MIFEALQSSLDVIKFDQFSFEIEWRRFNKSFAKARLIAAATSILGPSKSKKIFIFLEKTSGVQSSIYQGQKIDFNIEFRQHFFTEKYIFFDRDGGCRQHHIFWQYFLETLLLLLLVLDSYEATYGGQKITLKFSKKENNFRKM